MAQMKPDAQKNEPFFPKINVCPAECTMDHATLWAIIIKAISNRRPDAPEISPIFKQYIMEEAKKYPEAFEIEIEDHPFSFYRERFLEQLNRIKHPEQYQDETPSKETESSVDPSSN